MPSLLKDRAREARELANEPTVPPWARKLGMTSAAIYQIESGKTLDLKAKTAEGMSRLSGLSAEWIRTGKLPKFLTRDAHATNYRLAESTGDDEALAIPFMEAQGSCGGGTLIGAEEMRRPLLKEPAWFKRYGVRPEDTLAVWADGDSMSDFIVDGDIVIFNTAKRTPRSGVIFLIAHPDGLRIKRLRRDIDGSWVLESNNPDKRRFPDERISPDSADLLEIRGEFIYRQGG